MFVDYVLNGQSYGQVAERVMGCHFDRGYMRPYLDNKGRRCVTVNSGRYDSEGRPVYIKRQVTPDMIVNGLVLNATTSLRKLEWVMLDQVVLKAARERLRAWADLAAANTFGGFDGMSKMILEHETMSDPGEAFVDMEALTEGRSDATRFQLEGLPLPITHADFWVSKRRLAISRNTGTPIDMTMGEACARRVAEKIEKTTIGTVTGLAYGGTPIAYGGHGGTTQAKVYGYTNFPARLTKTNLTTPTGANPESTVGDVLAMVDQLSAQNFYGPFMLYHSTDWDQYMDNDYILTGGNVATQTLRNRLREIEVIQDVRRLDFLKSATNPFTLLMVQMTSDVARAVNGMDITTVQWETMGGMKLHFKVMAIQVPQLRADYNDRCGILHATTS